MSAEKIQNEFRHSAVKLVDATREQLAAVGLEPGAEVTSTQNKGDFRIASIKIKIDHFGPGIAVYAFKWLRSGELGDHAHYIGCPAELQLREPGMTFDQSPVRLRLSRAKGFDLQAHSLATNGLPAIHCARPHRWGNPWTVAKAKEVGFQGTDAEMAQMCANFFRRSLVAKLPATKAINGKLDKLRGKNLACWCALDAPCHVDVLLELAHAPIYEEAKP